QPICRRWVVLCFEWRGKPVIDDHRQCASRRRSFARKTSLSQAVGPKPSIALGVLLIVLAFACVAVMSAFGKAAKEVSTGTLVFFQNFISLLLFAPWAVAKGF